MVGRATRGGWFVSSLPISSHQTISWKVPFFSSWVKLKTLPALRYSCQTFLNDLLPYLARSERRVGYVFISLVDLQWTKSLSTNVKFDQSEVANPSPFQRSRCDHGTFLEGVWNSQKIQTPSSCLLVIFTKNGRLIVESTAIVL